MNASAAAPTPSSVRRILVTGATDRQPAQAPTTEPLDQALHESQVTAQQLVDRYCRILHTRHGSYLEVSRITGLDRRTVKKAITGQRS